VALAPLIIRNDPAADESTVQPDVAPNPVGCDASVDEVAEKFVGVTQPAGGNASQIFISTDLTAVVVGSAEAVKVYVTPEASAKDVDSAIVRPVIGDALAVTIPINGKTLTAIANKIARDIANLEYFFSVSFFIFPS
jgi:hypothetical protein